MIKNIIFDFGNVIVPWNPRIPFERYFGDKQKAAWFIENICPIEWHSQVDKGMSFKEVIAQGVAKHPEWEKEINLYFDFWEEMFGPQTEGIYEFMQELKTEGFHLFGLTNWSYELFPRTVDMYPAFSLLEDYVISGKERILKPDREIYLRLLNRFGLKAEECIFLDDVQANVDGANAVGIHGIRFENVSQARSAVKDCIEKES